MGKEIDCLQELQTGFLKMSSLKKTEFLDQKKPESLSFLRNDKIKGIVFQEYKINVSRIFIELLKFFEAKEGEIIFRDSFHSEEIAQVIQCNPIRKRSFIIPIEVPLNFSMVSQLNEYIFRFVEYENKLQVNTLSVAANQLLKEQIGIEIQKNILFKREQLQQDESTEYLSEKTIKNILRVVKKPLPCSFENLKMDDNYETCLEKFDLAKQTGISYSEFKKLFYRYGTGIDEMIEYAYDTMNEIRDAEKIWDYVERLFQEKYEWKI